MSDEPQQRPSGCVHDTLSDVGTALVPADTTSEILRTALTDSNTSIRPQRIVIEMCDIPEDPIYERTLLSGWATISYEARCKTHAGNQDATETVRFRVNAGTSGDDWVLSPVEVEIIIEDHI